MALATYANLKTSIANWLNRTDLTTEIAEDFIVLGPEPRVIVRFWIITVMLVLFGLATLKLR